MWGFLAVVATLILAAAANATAATPSEHLVFVSNRDGDRDVYAVNPDGSHLAALTRNRTFESAELSSDGRQLVVARAVGVFRTALITVSSDGRHERVLANGDNVGLDGFSRDGQWIAYHQGSDVGVMRLDGSESRMISTEEGSAFVDWSPDSARLLVKAANDDLVVFNRDGTAEGVIAHQITDAAWGQSGIAIVRDTDSSQVLSAIDVQGNAIGNIRAVAHRVDLIGWSPDGRRLAAVTRQLSGNDLATYWDLGSGAADALVSSTYVSDGAWSPDGQELAIANAPNGGDEQIDVFDLPSTRIGTIRAASGFAIDSFAWSPSERRIAFASGFQLFTATPQGTGRSWLTDRADAALVGWSPGAVPKSAPRARPLPRSETATVTLLRTHAPVAEIATDGYWAGAVVLSDRFDCTHVAAWRAGTSKTLRFQLVGPCDGRPPLLYDLAFASPGLGWRQYLCPDICYVTPIGASVRNPGESHSITDPQAVERRPQRPRPGAQVTDGVRASLSGKGVVLTRLRARLRRVIRAPSRIIDFELEHVGLYYAYNTRGHGRVVFVPVARLFG